LLAPQISPKYFARITLRTNLRIYLCAAHLVLEARLMLETIIVVLLVLMLIGSLPLYPYSRGWGYRGTGGLGTILLIVIILWALGVV
jgi:hypothetical protein